MPVSWGIAVVVGQYRCMVTKKSFVTQHALTVTEQDLDGLEDVNCRLDLLKTGKDPSTMILSYGKIGHWGGDSMST